MKIKVECELRLLASAGVTRSNYARVLGAKTVPSWTKQQHSRKVNSEIP